MTDEPLRRLERRVTASPEDSAARLRLARELIRVGRRADAREQLEGTRGEARDLHEALWREALAQLAPVLAFPFLPLVRGQVPMVHATVDASDRWVAWWDGERGGIGSGILDLEKGALVRTSLDLEGAPHHPVRDGFIREDRSPDRTQTHLTAVLRTGSGVSVHAADLPPREDLLAIAPNADRLVTILPGRAVLRLWPSLHAHDVIPGDAFLGVDWSLSAVVGLSEERLHVRRHPWGQHLVVPLPPARERRVDLVGNGLAVERGSGLHLVLLATGAIVTLEERIARSREASLDATGSSIRAIVDGRLRRWDIDVARASATRAPLVPGEATGDATHALFHPLADVAVLHERRWGRPRITTFAGDELAPLPERSSPLCWTRDGLGLVLVRVTELGESRIEVWRVPRSA